MKKRAKTSNQESFFDRPVFRIILTAASTLLSVIILVFSSLIIINVNNNDYELVPTYLLWMFVFLGLVSIVLYLKKRTKLHLIKCIVIILIDIVLGIMALFAKDNPFIFVLIAGFYCLTIVIDRLFELIHDHSLRSIVLNALIIALLVFLSIGIFTTAQKPEAIQSILLIECIFISIVSFIEAMTIALAQLKFKVLFKVIVSTFSLEVLIGLLIIITVFSFAFVSLEPSIETYPDALWYCFAVVTTIGFGDIAAETAIGRILTVILGLYGLIVVAVITSVVVNFYNETNGKKDQKELKDIKKDEDRD